MIHEQNLIWKLKLEIPIWDIKFWLGRSAVPALRLYRTGRGYALQCSQDFVFQLSREEICRLVTPIFEALDYVHLNSVVHRDIKPINIMLTNDGVIKVMDFGIAHVEYSTLTHHSRKRITHRRI